MVLNYFLSLCLNFGSHYLLKFPFSLYYHPCHISFHLVWGFLLFFYPNFFHIFLLLFYEGKGILGFNGDDRINNSDEIFLGSGLFLHIVLFFFNFGEWLGIVNGFVLLAFFLLGSRWWWSVLELLEKFENNINIFFQLIFNNIGHVSSNWLEVWEFED